MNSFNPPPRTISRYSPIPIIHELGTIYLILHNAIRDFPKLERFSIGVSILQIILDCIKHCFLATTLPVGTQKLHAVATASAHFDALKLYVRLSLDMHALEESAYLKLIPHFGSIGTMLGGWLKETQKSNSPPETNAPRAR